MAEVFLRPATLPAALARHAQTQPERLALRFIDSNGNSTLSYRELHERACALAQCIRTRATAGDRAVLLLQSGPDYVTAFFACLYAGVIAVPAYPPESVREQHLRRLNSIVGDAQPRLIMTTSALAQALSEARTIASDAWPEVLLVDELQADAQLESNIENVSLDAIAFLQYTSGSTSTPKGVQVTHRNLEANEWAIRCAYRIDQEDVIVSWLPLYHDMGLIGGLLQGIYSGVPVVLMSPQYFLERPLRWLDAISRYGGTVSGGPDFAYRLCVERIREERLTGLDLSRWRLAFSGSEPIRQDSLQAFSDKFSACGFRSSSYLACYGLAEATLFVTGSPPGKGATLKQVDAAALKKNRVEAGSDVTIVGCGTTQDEHLLRIVAPSDDGVQLPDNQVGEIWISGPSVAQGYWRREEESAKTFVKRDGRIWLRTGDLGFRHGEELFVTGRHKDLLIVRGQNIYPQDVERTIEERIAEARKGRVAVFPVDFDGNEGLGVAAEIGRRTSKRADLDELVQKIRNAVGAAHHEVPCVVALLNPGALPKTSSGKLQRSACRTQLDAGTLDAMAIYRDGQTRVAAPQLQGGEQAPGLGTRITTLWLEHLKRQALSLDDNFFAAGGNSVRAVQLMAELRETLGISLELRDLYEAPTLREFIARAERATNAGSDRIPIVPRDRHIPQLAAQERLWIQWQLDPQSAAYNIPAGLSLRGEIDESALCKSIAELVERHEALRTTYYEHAGRGHQRVHERIDVPLRHEDLSGYPAEQREQRARSLREQEARAPFDLESGPLLRARLVVLAEGEAQLLLTLHHIAADGWSLNILLHELAQLYGGRVQQQAVRLPALEVQLADYAAWERAESSNRAKQPPADGPGRADEPLLLPLDAARRPERLDAERLSFRLPPAVSKALQDSAERNGTTLFAVLLSAFQTLLYRYSGQSSIRLGIPFAGRWHHESLKLVGCFVRTQMLQVDVDGRLGFKTLLARTHEAIKASQQAPRDDEAPVFEAMFNHQQRDTSALRRLPGLLAEELPWNSLEAKCELQLQSEQDDQGRVRLSFDYASALFERSMIERFAAQYVRLVEQIVENDSRTIGDLDLSDAADTQRLSAWEKHADASPEILLLQQLSEQAATTPDAIALVDANGSLDYRSLHARANHLALRLRAIGVGPEVRVGLIHERSIEMMVVLLAIAKAGGVHVPLDPDYPAVRLEHMVRDSGIALLIGQKQLLSSLPAAEAVRTLEIEQLDLVSEAREAPALDLHPDHLAYVIYTSGSSGLPKGVGVSHRALGERLRWMKQEYALGADEVFLQKAPLSFDVSIWECFLPLVCGGRLLIARGGEHRDPRRLVELVREHGVTTLHFVPSLLQLFVGEKDVVHCTSLRRLFSGGEVLPLDLCRLVQARLPGLVLHNRYGPTEAAINATHWRCGEETGTSVPIGRPLANTSSEVLDDTLTPAPIGGRGELYLGGLALARGYLGRPALTAERFVPGDGGERRYRSGDLARWRGDGALEFLGRADDQIKLRGTRIELAEIRARLLQQPGLRDAAVVVHEGRHGQQIVAYVVAPGRDESAELNARLKAGLGLALPEYMLPAHFVRLDALPLTPSGKLDRRALPEPALAERQYRAPRTEDERRIADIWQTVLGQDRIGLDDDFFELGGHSLLATQIVSRTRQAFDIELPLRSLFDASRLSSFTQRVIQAKTEGRRDQWGVIAIVDRAQRIPLSFAQQRMWFLWQLDRQSPAYNVGGLVRLSGPLDVERFDRALQALIARHETLRTVFPSENGAPFQCIVNEQVPLLSQIDLSWLPEAKRAVRLQALTDEQAHQPFDLERGPLLRACLVRSAQDEHHLLVTLHHIVAEGWAMDIFARELTALYEAAITDGEPALLPLPVQYLDYAAWQREWLQGGEMQRQLDYWSMQLASEHPVLELPGDRARPAVQSHRGDLHRFEIDAGLARALRAFNAEHGLTSFMTVTAALAILLYRYGGQDDLRIGVPVANRIRPESEGLIGAFLNTQVLRLRPTGQMQVGEFLRQIRDVVIEGQANQDLPFDQLVEALKPQRSASYHPLFQVMCNVQRWDFQQTHEVAGGLRIEYQANDARATKFDLYLEVTDIDDRLRCCLTYSTDLFDRDRIERMAAHWQNLLQAMVESPACRLAELEMLADVERAALLGPVVEDEYAAFTSVQARFEERVRIDPQAPALSFAEQTLSYGELNARANRLAHALIALGVGPEVRVGLALRRSPEMVVGLLAVLKAGGVYVPLDPEYPQERLRYMVSDAGIGVLLAHADLLDVLSPLPGGVRSWSPECDGGALASHSAANPCVALSDQHLAYVIYTSGSTGLPKGVTVAHGPLAMHCNAVVERFGMQPEDCELHFYSINFDAATERLLVPLLSGAQLVLRAQGQWDAQEICALIRRHRVSVLGFTPSYGSQLALWLKAHAENLPVRLCITGGEALTPEHVHAIREAFAPAVFFNAYGPTETVVMPLAHALPAQLDGDAPSVPIGRVVGARRLYVLDADLALMPEGTAGELYVGGFGVARGYHERRGLTAERFVADPFAGDGGRLYRTGDRVRLLRDGSIEYLGRIDQQVKIRGFRIELGEIESRLQSHAQVAEAAVRVIEAGSGRQLAAYVVPSRSVLALDDEAAQADLRERLSAHLQAELPEYMVPAHFVLLERLPLTANGKLDRAALPLPRLRKPDHAASLPRNETEQRLLSIWRESLGVANLGIDDNFFELGGDSILSIQVVSRAREAGIGFSAKDLFRYQSIRKLAAAAAGTSEAVLVDQGPVSGPATLTPIQQWFFSRALPRPDHWNQSLLLECRERLDPLRLNKALNVLVGHHDALRLRFTPDSLPDRAWQARYESATGLSEPAAELLWSYPALDDAERLACFEVAQSSLDLARGPLLRAVLVDGARQRLLIAIHHLVVDGVSWRVLLEDLQSAYRQLGDGTEVPSLPAKTNALRDWSARLQAEAASQALREELHWWRQQIGGPFELPCDDPNGANLERHARQVSLTLDASSTCKLLQQATQAYRTRVDELLLVALVRVLNEWSGHRSALVQIEGHGREERFEDIDLSRTVGWFTSAYPVRLSADESLGTSIKKVKEQLRAVPHKGLHYGVLSQLGDEAVRTEMAALPSAPVGFNYLGQFDSGFGADALFALLDEPSGCHHDGDAPLPQLLTLDSQIYAGELQMRWTFSDRVFDSPTIEKLARRFRQELVAVIEHCLSADAGGITPSDFPLAALSQQQLDALPVPFARIEDVYPLTPMQEGLLLHSLLEPGTGIYFMQDRYSIDSELDVERFDAAWRGVIARHDALRASFCWNAGETMLQIIHRGDTGGVEFLDWSELPAADHEARLQALLEEERLAGFDLLNRPPLRLRLIRLERERHWFVMSNHHILIDAWCRSLLMGDFFEIYRSLDAGTSPQLDPPPRYRDFISWLRKQGLQDSRHWWKQALAGFDQASELPSDHPIVHDKAGMRVADRYARIDAASSTRMRELAQRHQLTVNTFAQAAWALVLQRYNGGGEVLFGVTVAGRPSSLPEMQRAVGLFINTIPLRVPMPGAGERLPVGDWLQGLLARNLELREHEHVPLVDIQEGSELAKGRPLFDSLLVFENAPVESSVLDRAQGLKARSGSGRTHTNYPLTVVCYPGDELGLHLSYDQRFFEVDTIDRLLAEFRRLLLALVDGFHGEMADLPLLDDQERQALLEDGNRNRRDYPLDRGYVPLFEARVAAHPQRIAARCLGESWSYAELDRRANRLGHRLIDAGVAPDGAVALLAERGLPLLGMIVGSFKAGAGYVPLDPVHPEQRMLDILRSSAARVLVCTAACRETAQRLLLAFAEHGRPRLIVWESVQAGEGCENSPGIAITGQHLAYIIYTSGSTGKPKGVVVEQAGMLNNQLSKQPYLGLDERDVIAQTASQCFDISVWQFLAGPLCGACVEIVPDAIAHDPSALLEHLEATGISVLESVPSLIQGLLAEAPAELPSLRCLLPTGEAMPPELGRRWLERYPQVRLVNAYGPAECSDDVALFTVDVESTRGARLPIGSATDNNRLYLLGADLQPVPAGASAELFMAGVGVGRGYAGDPLRTAQSFLPDPHSDHGERLYRSGDLARRRADGVYEYVGRADHQVKLRGFRIELGEIEARLHEHPQVDEAAVAVQDGPAGRYLVGYVVAAAPVDGLSESLQKHLRTMLPEYMVPLHWQLLERLPRNANGKLDRKALPAFELGRLSRRHVEPRSELERSLAVIWADVLKLDSVGVTDDFLELGGHSLLATQIASRVQKTLQRGVPLRAMFECSTVEQLARYIESHQPNALTAQKASRISELMSRLETM